MVPEETFPSQKYPRDFKGRDHYFDWVDAILEGRKSCADFPHGGPLTETVLVGAMADRVATQWLQWDRQSQNVHQQPPSHRAGATLLPRRLARRRPGLIRGGPSSTAGERPAGEHDGRCLERPAPGCWASASALALAVLGITMAVYSSSSARGRHQDQGWPAVGQKRSARSDHRSRPQPSTARGPM